MIDFTESEIAAYCSRRIPGMKQTNTVEWRSACPVHSGKDPNFTINTRTGLATCHSHCGRGWDLIGLEMALQGWDFPRAKASVWQIIGRPEAPYEERDVEAVFDYTDAAGKLLYQVLRKSGKRFIQRRPSGNGWTWGIKGIAQVPYRLQKLSDDDLVFVVEGEKDVHTLERLGLTATCNNGGAGNFKPELAQYFTGKHVGIIADNDEPGREHSKGVAALLKPVAASVRIVELPNLPAKGDVTDFLNAGGTYQQIAERYAKSVEWTPEWDFSLDVPSEYDRYVFTLSDYIQAEGGYERFWDFTLKPGVPTPWGRLSNALGGGMRDGEVYVIGSNQGSGKTSLALQFGIHAMRRKHGVLMMSMEMDHRQVFQRMVGIEARVDLLDFQLRQRRGDAIMIELDKLNRMTRELEHYSLTVHTKPSVTTELLTEECVRLRRSRKIDFLIVDHLQLMSSTGSVRGDYEKFTAISRAMKGTAKELNIPILLISQTSRHQVQDKRSELDVSDLRGSGAIEEDAAAVMLLFVDKDDRDRTLANGTFTAGPVKTWLKLGKNRYGLTGACLPLLHFKTCTRFDLPEEDYVD